MSTPPASFSATVVQSESAKGGGLQTAVWSGSPLPGTVTITSATTERIQVSFEMTLPPAVVFPVADELVVTAGQFNVVIVQLEESR